MHRGELGGLNGHNIVRRHLPLAGRRPPVPSDEFTREMTVVGEAGFVCDAAQRVVGGSKHAGRMNDPLSPEVVAHRESGESPDDAPEVDGMNPDFPGGSLAGSVT